MKEEDMNRERDTRERKKKDPEKTIELKRVKQKPSMIEGSTVIYRLARCYLTHLRKEAKEGKKRRL